MTIAPDQYQGEIDDGATLQSLIDVAAEDAPAQTKSGKARKAEIADAINQSDIDAFMDFNQRMSGLMSKILHNKLDLEDLGKLSEDELTSIMGEFLDLKEVQRLLEVRYDMLRLAIFAHITETNKDNGVPDPAHSPGKALVRSLKKKFAREGGKLKARIDHAKLKQRVGDEVWEQITDEVKHPPVKGWTERVFNEDKFMAQFKKAPKTAMKHLQATVIPGGYGAQRLRQYDMNAEDFQE